MDESTAVKENNTLEAEQSSSVIVPARNELTLHGARFISKRDFCGKTERS